jgi:hypothetical protein
MHLATTHTSKWSYYSKRLFMTSQAKEAVRAIVDALISSTDDLDEREHA